MALINFDQQLTYAIGKQSGANESEEKKLFWKID